MGNKFNKLTLQPAKPNTNRIHNAIRNFSVSRHMAWIYQNNYYAVSNDKLSNC